MLWLVWRQHRAEALAAAVLLALIAVPVMASGLAMHADYASSGLSSCGSAESCAQIAGRFTGEYAEWGNRLLWVAFLPALVGVFVGAPLLAREFETGTWRLAFTQTVSRTRWLVTKLALVGGGAVLAAVACALLLSWWRQPIDEIQGRLRGSAFVVAWPSLGAATLFAFTLGVLTGALLRRTIASMGATLAVYLGVRITVEEYLRPRYLRPLTRITDPSAPNGLGSNSLGSNSLVLGIGWSMRAGSTPPDGVCPKRRNGRLSTRFMLRTKGIGK